jgi:hypothetical protein
MAPRLKPGILAARLKPTGFGPYNLPMPTLHWSGRRGSRAGFATIIALGLALLLGSCATNSGGVTNSGGGATATPSAGGAAQALGPIRLSGRVLWNGVGVRGARLYLSEGMRGKDLPPAYLGLYALTEEDGSYALVLPTIDPNRDYLLCALAPEGGGFWPLASRPIHLESASPQAELSLTKIIAVSCAASKEAIAFEWSPIEGAARYLAAFYDLSRMDYLGSRELGAGPKALVPREGLGAGLLAQLRALNAKGEEIGSAEAIVIR